MTGLPNRSEVRLKAAVIDRLLAGSHVDQDAVLISEMTVANWTRRADVVLANGKLWAFEIKSESDSLVRLPGQIETFRTHFEKFTVVAAERFEKAVLALVPEGVGVWIVDGEGNVKQKIAARQMTLSKEAYTSLMTATELRRLLAANGLRPTKEAPRATLVLIALRLPVADLASAARDAVKRRHMARHADFLNQQRRLGTLAAMIKLRRPQLIRANADAPNAAHDISVAEPDIQPDHPMLVHAPGGPVLKRRVD